MNVTVYVFFTVNIYNHFLSDTRTSILRFSCLLLCVE